MHLSVKRPKSQLTEDHGIGVNMKCKVLLGVFVVLGCLASEVQAQRSKKKDADFVKSRPAVGDTLPALIVYTPEGEEFQTTNLKDHYTVLVFGCLT